MHFLTENSPTAAAAPTQLDEALDRALHHWYLRGVCPSQGRFLLCAVRSTKNETAKMGATHPVGRWPSTLCPLLLRHQSEDGQLFSSDPMRCYQLIRLGRRLASLPPFASRRFRHGCACADAWKVGIHHVTDHTIVARRR